VVAERLPTAERMKSIRRRTTLLVYFDWLQERHSLSSRDSSRSVLWHKLEWEKDPGGALRGDWALNRSSELSYRRRPCFRVGVTPKLHSVSVICLPAPGDAHDSGFHLAITPTMPTHVQMDGYQTTEGPFHECPKARQASTQDSLWMQRDLGTVNRVLLMVLQATSLGYWAATIADNRNSKNETVGQ